MEIKYFTKNHHSYTQTIEADKEGKLQDSWKNEQVVYEKGLIISSEDLEKLRGKQISLKDLESKTNEDPIGKNILLWNKGRVLVTEIIERVH